MNILAFDTSGNFLSTALQNDNSFFEENRESGLRHSEHLLPAVNRLMENAGIGFPDLDLIVCSRGPGSFTGLRIGMSTAKGLSAGCGTPVVSVNTLDALSYGLDFFDGAVVPLIDARKKRFYAAVYEHGMPVTDYLDVTASELSKQLEKYKRVLFTGPGISLFIMQIETGEVTILPAANFTKIEHGLSPALINLGNDIFKKTGPDPDDIGPFYIRPSDADGGGK